MKVRRFRYAYLLTALMLVAFVRPFLVGGIVATAVVDLLLFVSLLAGAYAATGGKKFFVPLVVLGTVAAGLQAVYALSQAEPAAVAFLVSSLLLYAAVAWVMLRTLFGLQRRVGADTLCQAVSVFLLLGLVWAMAYALLELAEPGSFGFEGLTRAGDASASEVLPSEDVEQSFNRFVGFSFITMTTLGYGNVAPATPRADALTSAQALVGQIYIAVVIARLVAIELAQSMVHLDDRSTRRER